jgi:hypothetical protein
MAQMGQAISKYLNRGKLHHWICVFSRADAQLPIDPSKGS